MIVESKFGKEFRNHREKRILNSSSVNAINSIDLTAYVWRNNRRFSLKYSKNANRNKANQSQVIKGSITSQSFPSLNQHKAKEFQPNFMINRLNSQDRLSSIIRKLACEVNSQSLPDLKDKKLYVIKESSSFQAKFEDNLEVSDKKQKLYKETDEEIKVKVPIIKVSVKKNRPIKTFLFNFVKLSE